ncbi:phosphoglucosamine mutase [Bacteroidota bacterium]
MPLIRSISGLRATLGDDLLPSVLSNHAAAFEKILPKGKILVGRDGRPSGRWIEQIIAGTLTACGREVRILGVVPTPTVQLSVEHSNAAGGISITASHNPGEWNGLKFINSEGVFLDIKENTKLWKAVKFNVFDFVKQQKKVVQSEDQKAITNHIKTILDLPLFSAKVMQKIRNKKFKVVVDAVNASGSKAIPLLLKEFGCRIVKLYCDGSGVFPHNPEPLAKNLTQLAAEVKKSKADFGIAVDPDADRLVLADETGKPISEEKTIVLAIETVLSNYVKFKKNNQPPFVVVNQSTTKAVDDICEKYGAKVERSAVGEINVVKAMKKYNAVIGGEGSGGVILPACHYGRDSLVGTSLILFLLTLRNVSLSELTSSLPDYQMVKKKCTFNGDFNSLYSLVIDQFPAGKLIKGDGIKIVFPESWVQVRASNTEPIVRIIAEDPNLKEASKLVNSVLNICKKI